MQHVHVGGGPQLPTAEPRAPGSPSSSPESCDTDEQTHGSAAWALGGKGECTCKAAAQRVKTRVYLHRVCVQVDCGIAVREYAHRRAALAFAEQIVAIVIQTLPHENRACCQKSAHAREGCERRRGCQGMPSAERDTSSIRSPCAARTACSPCKSLA